MAQTVIALFPRAAQAQEAIAQLVQSGFSRDSIDLSTRTPDVTDASVPHQEEEHGGVEHFFRSLLGSGQESDRYTHVGHRSSLVTVHAQTVAQAEQAAAILDRYGAVDVNEQAAHYGYRGTTGADTTTTQAALPVIEEQLEVGKRVVETGGVRLRSRIIEQPVEEHLRLQVERVYVVRQPVNRPATEADLAHFKEETIEVITHAEVPVVAKEARIVEEVRLEKDVEERQETIRDTVRRTDVDVERFGTDEDRSRPSNP